MPYADPQSTHDPTTGQVIPASWGDIVRNDLEYLARNKPHCRVFNNAGLTIATTTATVVTFNSESLDVGAMHSTVTNTGRITVPSGEGGWHGFGASGSWAANGTGYRSLLVRLNGVTGLIGEGKPPVAGGDGTDMVIGGSRYQLAAGDYVEALVYQTSGGNLAFNSPAAWAEWVAI